MRLVISSIILMVGGLGLQNLEASPLPPMGVETSKVQTNIDPILDRLKPILKASGKVARIYYLGSCRKEGDFYWVSFPYVHVQNTSRSDMGLNAVRDVFRSEKDARVSEGPDGIIRIVIGQLPVTILETKISTVNFDQQQQYSANLALWRIEDNKEVGGAIRKLGIRRDGVPLRTTLGTEPAEGVPHLSASMVNLTLDQALDSVAKTFGGIVLYGVCTEPRFYTIHYVPLKP
jgi:hypothetical protein